MDIKCSHCGAINRDYAKYCYNCTKPCKSHNNTSNFRVYSSSGNEEKHNNLYPVKTKPTEYRREAVPYVRKEKPHGSGFFQFTVVGCLGLIVGLILIPILIIGLLVTAVAQGGSDKSLYSDSDKKSKVIKTPEDVLTTVYKRDLEYMTYLESISTGIKDGVNPDTFSTSLAKKDTLLSLNDNDLKELSKRKDLKPYHREVIALAKTSNKDLLKNRSKALSGNESVYYSYGAINAFGQFLEDM